MMLTRMCAKAMVWIFILFFIVALLGLGGIYIMQAEGVTVST